GVCFSNWYLSDDSADLKKWAIPGTNTIAPTNWMTFFEVNGFHPATNSGFGLNKGGEDIFLSYLPGNTNDRVADCVSFKGQENYRTWGRYGDGGAWWYTTMPTTNKANALAAQTLVITEIMFHPPTNAVNPGTNYNDEFIELYNPGSAFVTLTNEAGAYRIDGDVSFVFASNTTIAAGGYLVVVSFDPVTNATVLAAFLQTYGLEAGQINIVGPYSGKLSNHGGRVAVERPLSPDVVGDPGMFWVIVDEVIYFEQWPWPDNTDGTGYSLRRLLGSQSGNDPANWMGSLPTPGLSPGVVTLMGPYSGSVMFAPATAKFTAVIDDSRVTDSVVQVEFREGTNLLFVTSTEPYEYVWNESETGTYHLWARMIDAGGAGTNDSRTTTIGVLALVNVGASNIMDTAADIHGRLIGGGPVDVYICWGRTDQGTNRWWWDNATYVRSVNAEPFAIHVTGITPGTWYYRCFARAGVNEGWA
ncbi:MAG: lamin tail domain-containing protein, partial [bacterium]